MAARRGPSDDEFRDEIEAHVAVETDRLIADGVSPEGAAITARRTFGNVTRVREPGDRDVGEGDGAADHLGAATEPTNPEGRGRFLRVELAC